MRVVALRQGDETGVDTPVLSFAHISNRQLVEGFLTDPYELEFQIRERSGVVFPDPDNPSAYQAVDLESERLGVGRFAPTWLAEDAEGGDLEPGAYEIRWRVREFEGQPWRRYTAHFQILESDAEIPDAYATVTDMRAQGVPISITDAAIVEALELACAELERITDRFFFPKYVEHVFDGRGKATLRLEDPIIGIEEVNLMYADFNPSLVPLTRGDLKVYNRHIRSGLTAPDDRDDPRLEFRHLRRSGTPYRSGVLFGTAKFTDSQQNIQVTGLFGYTEPDASPTGRTPRAIHRVNMMMAMRELMPLYSTFGGLGAVAGPIKSERTLDQEVVYSDKEAAAVPSLVGDDRIDRILEQYMRPPRLGSP